MGNNTKNQILNMSIKSILRSLTPYGYFLFRQHQQKSDKIKKDEAIRGQSIEIINQYYKDNKVIKLNFGTGGNPNSPLTGWLNSDLFAHFDIGVIRVDVTQPFPFPNNSADYINSEHFVEHLTLKEAKFYFDESFRVLKKGGRIRTSLPSFDFLIDLYAGEKTEKKGKYIKWAMDELMPETGVYEEIYVINNQFHDWGHQFIHNETSLKRLLEDAGFSKVRLYKPGISDDENFRDIEKHGLAIPDWVNEMETFVIEAEKE
jgi:predicted SAM-dependent methyltransferase